MASSKILAIPFFFFPVVHDCGCPPDTNGAMEHGRNMLRSDRADKSDKVDTSLLLIAPKAFAFYMVLLFYISFVRMCIYSNLAS